MEKINYKDVNQANFIINGVVPVMELSELAVEMTSVIIEQSEDGYFNIDRITKDITLPALYAQKYSNVDFEDLDLIQIFDILQTIEMGTIELWKESFSYRILNDMIESKITEAVEANQRHDSLKELSDNVTGIVQDVANVIMKKVDQLDPNKAAKVFGKGFEVIAKKLPDMSKPEEAGKVIDKVVASLSKLETINKLAK